eukprot:GHUV01029601.1.p1 GENE.GHUV01029601.1~~GHUV01029601.1.p1  ORF type:complete len:148 (-),score=5.60 GHUV01029601.1:891-1334(-)
MEDQPCPHQDCPVYICFPVYWHMASEQSPGNKDHTPVYNLPRPPYTLLHSPAGASGIRCPLKPTMLMICPHVPRLRMSCTAIRVAMALPRMFVLTISIQLAVLPSNMLASFLLSPALLTRTSTPASGQCLRMIFGRASTCNRSQRGT